MMTKEEQYGAEIAKLFATWTETASKFWQDTGQMADKGQPFPFSSAHFSGAGSQTDEDDEKYKNYKTWENTWNTCSTFLKVMMSPENQEEFAKGASTFTEALTQAAGESLENILELQSQLVQNMAKAGEHTKTFDFGKVDHSTFETFREFYEAELQKYFQIPKIGLPREFHEQLTDLADKTNIFSSHLIEFLYLLSTPFEKTNRTMQEKINEMMDSGDMATDSQQLYNEWVKILEGNYMKLLQSQEYTKVLNNTIGSLASYKNVKNDITSIFLKDLQIPTNDDMDEVYKDLYVMKKKFSALSKRVALMEKQLESKQDQNVSEEV